MALYNIYSADPVFSLNREIKAHLTKVLHFVLSIQLGLKSEFDLSVNYTIDMTIH